MNAASAGPTNKPPGTMKGRTKKVAYYDSIDFCRMAFRNVDSAIVNLLKGDVDEVSAKKLVKRLNNIQDGIAVTIADIRAAQENDNDMEQV